MRIISADMRTLTLKELTFVRDQALTGPNKVRLALGILEATQQELADAANIKPPHLSDIVNGRYSRLALDTARRISRALGACIEDIFPPPCAVSRARRAVKGRKRMQVRKAVAA